MNIPELYGYQSGVVGDIYGAWDAGSQNVLLSMPCGSGKTYTFSHIIHDLNVPTCAIVHRRELVSQMSLSLARFGHRHRIIAPKKVVQWIANLHYEELGASFYDPGSPCAVAGVDTLGQPGRQIELAQWMPQVQLTIMDEAHHVLTRNKWGRAAMLFPNANCLGVTGTPKRADGMGLGRDTDGIFDTLLEGPSMRWLIDNNFLCDYRIICPPNDFHRENVAVSAGGDFSPEKLSIETKRASITGDVVEHYLRFARGELGVTFCPDVEDARETATAFNQAGVPAAVVTAKTPDADRIEILRRFRSRELLQLCNVDIFGEGFDLPAITVVSMKRATQSWALYVQQFARALRTLAGKTRGIIIDHVGNVKHHRVPDKPIVYTLDRREKRSRSKNGPEEIPMIDCKNCFEPFYVTDIRCPNCQWKPEPERRDAPDYVDGDLVELDEITLAYLRGEVSNVDRSSTDVYQGLLRAGKPYKVAEAARKRHELRQGAQESLRRMINLWAGVQHSMGRSDQEAYRRFYFAFGMDVLSAQALGWREAHEMAARIMASMEGSCGDHI